MGPPAIRESGHFYFAQTGHSHFAATRRQATLHYKSLSARLSAGPKNHNRNPLQMYGGNMKLIKLTTTLCAVGFLAIGALAQDKPGTIAGLEFQTPKNGMVKQYEDGRKAKVEWHKQQKDKDALLVSEVLTGVNTGTYIVGRFGLHWADMDKPSVTDAADLEEYKKVVAPYVDKVTAAYYEFLPKWSNPSADMAPPKYIAVVAFHIRNGKGDDFQSAIAKVHEANQKLKTPTYYSWHRLVNGGPGGTYVLT